MSRFAFPLLLILALSSTFMIGCQCNHESGDPVLKSKRIPEIHRIYDVSLSPEEVRARMDGVAEKLGNGFQPSTRSALDSTVSLNTFYCVAHVNAFRRSERVTRVMVHIRICSDPIDEESQKYIQHTFDTYIHDALADAMIPKNKS